jgi:FtsZ-binding cell division protein ZapB
MKRKALAFILLTIIVLSFASWLVYNQVRELQNQIEELQSQNSDLHEQVSELQDQNNELQGQNEELQEQLNELHKQIDDAEKVMITEFSSPTGWRNPVGVAMDVIFNITIMNTGTNDVEGLTLEIKRLNFDEDPFNITRKLDILHVGETTEIQEFIIISMDRYFSEFYSSSFVATLKLGELALHERTLQITKRQF